LLAAFNVLAMLSIGVFVIPVTAGVIAACAAHDVTVCAEPIARALPDDALAA
jgi:hypothetical protein